MTLLIKSLTRRGHRRAGVFHPPQVVANDADAFTKEQLKALHADPLLEVTEAEGEPQAALPTKTEDLVKFLQLRNVEIPEGAKLPALKKLAKEHAADPVTGEE